MAEAKQSRCSFVPRAADARTPIVQLMEVIRSGDAHFDAVDRFASNNAALIKPDFRQHAYKAIDQSMWAVLTLVPRSDLDALLVIGTASLLFEQIDDQLPEEMAPLGKAMRTALGNLTAFMSNTGPVGVEVVEAHWSSLASSIRQDIAVASALRDAERDK